MSDSKARVHLIRWGQHTYCGMGNEGKTSDDPELTTCGRCLRFWRANKRVLDAIGGEDAEQGAPNS